MSGIETLRAVSKRFESFDCTREAVTKEPLVRGQQLVAPEGAGNSGIAICSKLAEGRDVESVGAPAKRSGRFDDE